MIFLLVGIFVPIHPIKLALFKSKKSGDDAVEVLLLLSLYQFLAICFYRPFRTMSKIQGWPNKLRQQFERNRPRYKLWSDDPHGKFPDGDFCNDATMEGLSSPGKMRVLIILSCPTTL